MSQRGVERTLGKLVTDEGFRGEFLQNPRQAGLRLGVELSEQEVEALLAIPPAALDEFCGRLDGRICKLFVNRQPIGQE
jgi:hypothetical protein